MEHFSLTPLQSRSLSHSVTWFKDVPQSYCGFPHISSPILTLYTYTKVLGFPHWLTVFSPSLPLPLQSFHIEYLPHSSTYTYMYIFLRARFPSQVSRDERVTIELFKSHMGCWRNQDCVSIVRYGIYLAKVTEFRYSEGVVSPDRIEFEVLRKKNHIVSGESVVLKGLWVWYQLHDTKNTRVGAWCSNFSGCTVRGRGSEAGYIVRVTGAGGGSVLLWWHHVSQWQQLAVVGTPLALSASGNPSLPRSLFLDEFSRWQTLWWLSC